jgi:hypothetical protein
MALPPTPAKASIMIAFSVGAACAMCSATFLRGLVSEGTELGYEQGGLCYGLRGHAEPCFLGHANTMVVTGEDAVSLLEVPGVLSVGTLWCTRVGDAFTSGSHTVGHLFSCSGCILRRPIGCRPRRTVVLARLRGFAVASSYPSHWNWPPRHRDDLVSCLAEAHFILT